MIGRTITYLLPFYLIFIELILRLSLNTDTQNFIAPTLASVGIGLIVPLTIHKNKADELPEDIRAKLEDKKITYMTVRQKRFNDFVWLALFILISFWIYTIYLSCRPNMETWFSFPKPMFFGFSNYFIGVIFSEIKEVM